MIFILQIMVMLLCLASGVFWFGLGIALGLEAVQLMWQYVWPATKRREKRNGLPLLPARTDPVEGDEEVER